MIVVTGSTGFLGSHVVPKLIRQFGADQVVCLIPDSPTIKMAGKRMRDEDTIEWYRRLGVNIETYPAFGEVSDYRSALARVSNITGVVYLAANNNRASGFQRLQRDNVTVLERFVEALPQKRIPFVFTSSVMAETTERLSEEYTDVVLQKILPYGVSKLAAERVLAKVGAGLDIRILRLASVYGKDSRAGLIASIASLAKLSSLAFIPKLEGRASIVHVADAATAISAALEPAFASGTFVVDDTESLSIAEMVTRYANKLRMRSRSLRLPELFRVPIVALLRFATRQGISLLDVLALFEDIYLKRGKSVWDIIPARPRKLFEEIAPHSNLEPAAAIIGTSGFIGAAIAKQLLIRGVPLRCGIHTSELPFDVNDGMELSIERCDLSDSKSTEHFLMGIKTLVYAAGLTTAHGQKTEAEYMKTNYEDVVELLKSARKAGVERLIFLGSQALPENAYGLSKARAEAAVRDSGLDYIILKPALVVGERGLVATLIGLVKMVPILPVPWRAPRSTELVDVVTIGKAVLYAIENPDECNCRVFTLGSTDTVSLEDIIMKISAILSKRMIVIPVPRILLLLGAKLGNLILPKFPLNTEVIHTLYREKAQPTVGETPFLTESCDDILRRYV